MRWILFASILAEEVDFVPVQPLRPVHTGIVCRQLGYPNTGVGCPYCGDFHPTICVYASACVGMFPLFREAAGYVFKRIFHIHFKEAIQRYDEGGEVVTFMYKRLQVLIILLLLFHLKTLIRRLFPVGDGVSVHNTHAVNTVRPSLP